MGTGLYSFLLGISLTASFAADVPGLNPLKTINTQVSSLTSPINKQVSSLTSPINKQVSSLAGPIKSVPGRVQKQLVGNIVERTFTDYYFDGHKYVTVVSDNDTGEVLDCMLIGDREFIAYMIGDKSAHWSGPVSELARDAPNIKIINITTDLIDDYIDRCDGKEPNNDTRPFFQKFISGLKNGPQTLLKHAVIFPGTKWCGAGDVARNYDDLGHMAETDKCCRDHDHAIESIDKGKEKYGLKNNLLYTMTKCEDDQRFNDCLVEADSIHAGAVGTTYFNVLKTRCFDKRKKARCANRLLTALTPCREYVYDENSPETWQIFDPIPFVPNASIPMRAVNDFLHKAPGIGDVLALI